MTQQYMDKLAEDRAALASRREENKGLVALAAAQALSKGSGLRQGLANMFGAVGAEAGRLSKDVRESEQLIRRSEMTLAQAKQAREDGLNDKAMQLERQAYTDAVAAHNAKKTGIYEQQRLAQAKELDEARTAREETREEARTRRAETAAGLAHDRAVAVAEIQAGRDKSTDLTRMADSIEANLKRTNPEMSEEERRDLAFERAASRLGRYPADVRGGLATDQLRAAVEAAINKETESLRMQLSGTRDPARQADLQRKIDDIANSTRARFPSAYPPAGGTSAPSASSGSSALPAGFVPVSR
jgi:chromosome segregation ATPase